MPRAIATTLTLAEPAVAAVLGLVLLHEHLGAVAAPVAGNAAPGAVASGHRRQAATVVIVTPRDQLDGNVVPFPPCR